MNRILRCLSAIAVLGAAFLLGPNLAIAADKIVLGMPVKPPALVHLPPFYAIDNGIFKKNGLDVEVKFFRGGVATHRAATSAQSTLDAAWIPGPIVMTGISKGSGLKMFHSMAFLFEAQLATAPGIDTPQKLRGKTIGIEGRGGYSHLGARAVLDPAGVSDNEVKYIKTPPPARVPFLVKGKADAVLIHVEQVLLAQKLRPGIVALANLWRSRPGYLYAVFVAPESKLKSNRDAYVRFAVAMMQSNRAIYKDKAGFLKTARKWAKPVYKKHPDIMSKTYDIFVKDRIWSVNNGLPKATIKWTNEFNVSLKKYKGAAPSYGDLIDQGIAKDALAKAGEVPPSEK
ncbi:MAG: ABC transporter substrate-binding protein [Candidatus Methylomirabilales bacterium]